MSVWRNLRLKDLCIDAGQYGLGVSSEEYVESGVRLLRTTDISSGILTSSDRGVYIEAVPEARFTLRGGDLLLSRSGTPPGQSYLVRHEDEGMTFAGYLVRFRPRTGVDPRFLAYVARSAGFQHTIQAEAVASTIQNFNAERYANMRVVAPDPAEQCRIADFLDSEIARIDRLVSAREKQVAVLDECEYAEVTDSLIPGSLTAASGEWPWAWLPAPLDDAPLVRLGYIARLQSGLTVDGKRDLSGDVVTRPYLRVANVQADRIHVDSISDITVPADVAKRSTLLSGDVLMTEGGDLDKLGRGTVWRGELKGCLHQNHVFAVRPDAQKLDADYLSLMTRTVHGRCYFESTGVKTTNLASTNSSKILGFPILLPELEIQHSRVRVVQRKLDGIGRARRRLQAQLELLAERRQALITAAVTGQLDVTTARPAHDHNL